MLSRSAPRSFRSLLSIFPALDQAIAEQRLVELPIVNEAGARMCQSGEDPESGTPYGSLPS